MTRTPTFSTLQCITEILSFKTDAESLIPKFEAYEVCWDDVVRVSSYHLMLPALYCQLKAKKLLPYIPKDLELYLEKITAINRNRNEVLLNETLAISDLFNMAQIDHVFIKGIGLIAGNTFKDIGERMIGDIDIVVAPDQLQEAFDLLEANGYTERIAFDYEPINYRHLARQINPEKMGAVELHQEVLIHTYKHLIDKTLLLKNKQCINGINVPSAKDAIRIAILTTQINDKAHLFGYLKLKSIYDCLVLGLAHDKRLLHDLSTLKQSQSFLQLSSIFFSELKPTETNSYSRALEKYYYYRMSHPKIGKYLQKTLYMVDSVMDRLNLFLGNKSYRLHIIKNKLNPLKE